MTKMKQVTDIEEPENFQQQQERKSRNNHCQNNYFRFLIMSRAVGISTFFTIYKQFIKIFSPKILCQNWIKFTKFYILFSATSVCKMCLFTNCISLSQTIIHASTYLKDSYQNKMCTLYVMHLKKLLFHGCFFHPYSTLSIENVK